MSHEFAKRAVHGYICGGAIVMPAGINTNQAMNTTSELVVSKGHPKWGVSYQPLSSSIFTFRGRRLGTYQFSLGF